MKFGHALLGAAAALLAGQALACYTVYDRNNQVVYNSLQPPVDMSRPLHQTLPAAFPGGHMVFDTASECPASNPDSSGRLRVASSNGRSPLLTEASTAQSLGLPHTLMAGGVAVVPERPDSMRPGIVLAESGMPAGSYGTAMGAGPARNPTSTMGAGPAPKRGNMITEMHNPPLTAVQPAAPQYRAR